MSLATSVTSRASSATSVTFEESGLSGFKRQTLCFDDRIRRLVREERDLTCLKDVFKDLLGVRGVLDGSDLDVKLLYFDEIFDRFPNFPHVFSFEGLSVTFLTFFLR